MKKIIRSKSFSLIEAGKQGASRSFHLGNLTIRDIVPVLFGCQAEVFDLNTTNDGAYVPTQITFQGTPQLLDIQRKTKYVVSSLLNKPPKVNNPLIDDLLLKAFEETATLGGFWMHINRQVFDERSMTTFSEKIVNNEILVSQVLNKLISSSNDELLADMFSRYIGEGSKVYTLQSIIGDRLHYCLPEGDTISLHKQDVVSSCMHLFTHWSKLSRAEKGNFSGVIEQCSGPIFCIELTSVLIFLIDMMKRGNGTVHHIGGQAMYGYTQSKVFNEKFKQILTLVDDDNNLSNGIQIQGMEILPAHFFRFLTFSSEINAVLKEGVSMLDAMENIKKQKSALIKGGNTIDSDQVQLLIQKETETKQSQQLILADIKNHEAIRRMPDKTLYEGVLNQLYESQLDYVWNIKQGFNPREERQFLAERPIEQVELLIKKII